MDKRMTLDVALHEVHASFGGRKGLIGMEEEYQVSHSKTTYQLLVRVAASYFYPSKLLITSLLAMGIYGLLCLAPTFDTAWPFSTIWVRIGWTIVQALAVGYTLFQLVKYSNRGAFSQKLSSMIVGASLFHWIGKIISLDEWMYTHAVPASLFITLFLIYEIAAVELILNHIRENGTPKIM